MKKLIGIVVILAVLLMGSYYGTGIITQNKLKETVNVIRTYNGIYVELKDYQRGWFHSTARIDWRLNIPERIVQGANGAQRVPAQKYEFTMPISIDHGPIIFSDAGVKFGLGYAQTEVVLPEKYVKQFNELFTKESTQPKMQFSQFINYLGKSRVSLNVPPFKLEAAEATGKLTWKGMHTSISMTADLSHVGGDILVKGMDFAKDNMKTTLSEISSHYDLSKTSYGFYTGSVNMKFPSLVVTERDKKVFDLDDYAMESSSNINGDVLNSHLNMSLKSLMSEGEKYGPGRLEIALRNLDVEAMGRINKLSMQMQNSNKAQKQQATMAMMSELPKLFSKGPELEISKLEMTLPEGQITGNLLINLPESASKNIMSMIQGVKGNAHLELPRKFVHTVLVESIAGKMMADQVQQAMASQAEQGELTAPEAKNQAAGMADKRINAMVQSGMLVSKNDKLVVDMHLEGGRLTVNGKPFTPAMMQF